MKKLIPMIAGVACAITAFAAQKTPLTVSDFEALNPGDPLSMEGTTWSKAETDEAPVIATYEDSGTTAYTYGKQDTLTANAVGDNYLAIDTSAGPLYRNAIIDKTGSLVEDLTKGDLYIDTLVKFTVSDVDAEITAEGDAKLALGLQAGAEEGAAPSLKLCCGDLNAETKELGKKTVTLNAGEITLNDTTWYRLTVRALKSAETDDMGVAIAAFKIFLNGNELAATDDTTEFLACVAGTSLTAVGFKGNGGVDDVAFADESGAPSFAIPPATDITVTWTVAEIAGLTAGEKELTAEELAKGTIDVAPGTTFTVTFAKGYMGDASQKFDEAGAIVAQKVAFTFTDKEGNVTPYASLAEAIKAGKTTLALANTIVETDVGMAEVEGELTIDLAGNSYTATVKDVCLISVGLEATVKVIDSVGGGSLNVTGTGDYTSIFDVQFDEDTEAEGTLIIGDADEKTDAGVTINGVFGVAGTIYKGKFDAENNDQETIAGLLADAETLEAVEEDGYIVVKAKGEPEVEVTVSVTKTGATATVSVADGAKVKAGDVITVTDVAAAADYKNATVTINGAEATEYTVTGEEESIVIVVSATPIAYATVKVEADDGVKSVTLTVNGEEIDPETYKADVEDAVVVTVAYELNDKKVLADGCTVPETVTLTENRTITITTDDESAEPTRPEAIEGGSTEQKAAYDAWAEGKDLTGKTDAQIIDAFILNADVTATAAELETKLGAEISADMVAALAAGGKPDFTALKAKYPNATFEFVEYTEIETSAKLFKLTAKFVPANDK